MKKVTKICLITAGSLVLAGGIIFVGAMSKMDWNFKKLSTVKLERNTYEISEDFENIEIDTDTANVEFALSDDEKCRVECYEDEKAKHTVTAKNGTLSVKVENKKHWYDYISINFETQKITVFLPKSEYNSVSVKDDAGNIKFSENFNFENVDVSLSTGNVEVLSGDYEKFKVKTAAGDILCKNFTAGSADFQLTTGEMNVSDVNCRENLTVEVTTGDGKIHDVSCQNFTATATTGDFSLKNVVATEKLTAITTTGNVKFEKCDGGEIFLKATTGDIKGSLLSEKVFIANSSTGDVEVPSTISGGKCEVKTTTGNIEITIE